MTATASPHTPSLPGSEMTRRHASLPCSDSGLSGFSVAMVPQHFHKPPEYWSVIFVPLWIWPNTYPSGELAGMVILSFESAAIVDGCLPGAGCRGGRGVALTLGCWRVGWNALLPNMSFTLGSAPIFTSMARIAFRFASAA